MPKTKLLLVSGLSTTALALFGLVLAWVLVINDINPEERLRLAMNLLDEGRWDVAGHIARELQAAQQVDVEKNSAWHYVQGVSKLQSVEHNLDTPKNRRLLGEASEHLAQADSIGFPIGYHAKGKFYLAWCNFNTYRWDEVVENLKNSDRLWPERRSDAFEMMVDANLRKSPPDFRAAEASISNWTSIPGMSASELARINLAKAYLAFHRGNMASCEELLTSIPPGSPAYHHALLWRGRWRLESTERGGQPTAPRSAALLEEANAIIREVKLSAETPNDLRRQASYLSGRILRALGKNSEAMSTLSGTRQSNPQSAEAIAAGIEETEILLELGNLDDAVGNLGQILRNVEELSLYNELWMSVPELRARLLQMGRDLRDKAEFARAIKVAEYIALAFPLSDSVRLQAEAYEQWAEFLAASPPGNSAQAQGRHRKSINEKRLAAAQLFDRLAQLELRSTDYPEILWRAITNFQDAGGLDKANTLLIDYLRFEDRAKRPRGFLTLGQNYMSAAQWQKALEPLDRCLMEHPTHPVSFEARLLAAKAKYELDRIDDAIELLSENLYGNSLSLRPTSQVWRDSLYQLGQTIFRKGDQLVLELRLNPTADANSVEEQLLDAHQRFLAAVDRLGEFVSRYPDDPRHYDALYLVAKSHRLAAETPQQIASSSKVIVETARRQLMQQRRSLLDQALQEFRTLHRTIVSRHDADSTSETNIALIRNCYFGEADTLYDLGRWDEALQAYQNAASRFNNQPESLEALLQVAQCYRKLGEEGKAQKALAQAEQVLNRIPVALDAQFVSLTRASRAGWIDLIGSLRSWN